MALEEPRAREAPAAVEDESRERDGRDPQRLEERRLYRDQGVPVEARGRRSRPLEGSRPQLLAALEDRGDGARVGLAVRALRKAFAGPAAQAFLAVEFRLLRSCAVRANHSRCCGCSCEDCRPFARIRARLFSCGFLHGFLLQKAKKLKLS